MPAAAATQILEATCGSAAALQEAMAVTHAHAAAKELDDPVRR
jgi:hypothetical protein